jgi:hypothetical protein
MDGWRNKASSLLFGLHLDGKKGELELFLVAFQFTISSIYIN